MKWSLTLSLNHLDLLLLLFKIELVEWPSFFSGIYPSLVWWLSWLEYHPYMPRLWV